MASLHEIAKLQGDILRTGEGWVIVWKTGRSWHSCGMFLDPDGRFRPEQQALVQDILNQDPCAVMLNGVKCGGFWQSMKTADVELNIRWYYDGNLKLLKDSEAFRPEPEQAADGNQQEKASGMGTMMVQAVPYKVDCMAPDFRSDSWDVAVDQKRIIRIRGDPQSAIP